MGKYLVIVPFTDLQDNDFQYGVGDEYPRSGANPTKSRIEELSSSKNRRGIPMIEEEPKEEPKEEPVIEDPEQVEEPVVEEPKEAPKPKRGRKKKNAD